MNKIINIYGDESNHLLRQSNSKDGKYMVIGFIWIIEELVPEYEKEIDLILSTNILKWNKLKDRKKDDYIKIIDHYFKQPRDNNSLINKAIFRCAVINKESMLHEDFKQSHAHFIFKIYAKLAKKWMETLITENYSYNFIIDNNADPDSEHNVLCLEVLKEKIDQSLVEKCKFACKASKDYRLIQLADFFCGAIQYLMNEQHILPQSAKLKKQLIDEMKNASGLTLKYETGANNNLFNIYHWTPYKK